MNLGEAVVILSPVAAKRMTRDLKAAISNYENREGEIKLPPGKDHPPESSVKKAIKSLYKTHKIGSKLLSINTSRRKKLPDN